jgi:hypothetical protein
MAEAAALVQWLLSSQNLDGGWPYVRGLSWVEPTGFSILALSSEQDPKASTACDRAVAWLLAQQKPLGGWSPNPTVSECTSVTSVATLALLTNTRSRQMAARNMDAALNWTVQQVYPDDLSPSLLFAKALHIPPPHAPGSVPWYPGTAGWVTPTSLSVLLMMRASQENNRPDLADVAHQSCQYLLSRRCDDKGWNHGGSKTRSEDAISYPETTGLALLALRAASILQPQESVAVARRFASNPESLEGLSWIQLALESPGQPVPDPLRLQRQRTVRDCALRLITLNAKQGNNVFLPQPQGVPTA